MYRTITSFAVRARGPCSVRYSPTRSQRSFVPIGNFWLHALSRSLSSSSSSHGSDFAAPPPSEDAFSAATRFAASSAACFLASLFALSIPARALHSPSTTTPASAPSAASHSVLIASKISAPQSSSTSSSPGCPTHPSAVDAISRRRAFSLRSAFFCFSSSFFAFALASLSSSAALGGVERRQMELKGVEGGD